MDLALDEGTSHLKRAEHKWTNWHLAMPPHVIVTKDLELNNLHSEIGALAVFKKRTENFFEFFNKKEGPKVQRAADSEIVRTTAEAAAELLKSGKWTARRRLPTCF